MGKCGKGKIVVLGENAALACTHLFSTTMYEISNNPHYIDNLQNTPFNHGLDKNELLLRRAHVSSNPIKLVIILANYTLGSSFTTQIPHLNGEEVSRLANL